MVHGDINCEHKCAWCGKPTTLYRMAGFHKYCSISCKTSGINSNAWKDLKYRKKHLEMFHDNCRSEEISYKRIAYQEMQRFCNMVPLDKVCTFYLGLTDDNSIKFGITSDNFKNFKFRYNTSRWKLENLRVLHKVFQGTPYQVSWIEREIKLIRKDASEHLEFNKLKEIIKLLRELIPQASQLETPTSSTTIETQS